MEIKAKVIQILPEQSGTSAKGEWLKRGFVVETQETYPKKIAIDVFKNDVQIPNIGTEATISVNIESREYNGKWYSNITAWKIDGFSTTNQNIPPATSVEDNDPNGDLPF